MTGLSILQGFDVWTKIRGAFLPVTIMHQFQPGGASAEPKDNCATRQTSLLPRRVTARLNETASSGFSLLRELELSLLSIGSRAAPRAGRQTCRGGQRQRRRSTSLPAWIQGQVFSPSCQCQARSRFAINVRIQTPDLPPGNVTAGWEESSTPGHKTIGRGRSSVASNRTSWGNLKPCYCRQLPLVLDPTQRAATATISLRVALSTACTPWFLSKYAQLGQSQKGLASLVFCISALQSGFIVNLESPRTKTETFVVGKRPHPPRVFAMA